jgi:hypothetical protein
MQTAAAFAGGLSEVADRDRLLTKLLPAEAEGSKELIAHARFRQLDAIAQWENAAKPPKSFLPETVDSITRLTLVRRVYCTLIHTNTNFAKNAAINANSDSLVFHRPNADLSVGSNIANVAYAIYRLEKGGPLSTPAWQAIGDRVADVLEHIAGDPSTGQKLPKLQRLITMVHQQLHPGVCPPLFRVGGPKAAGKVAAFSYK